MLPTSALVGHLPFDAAKGRDLIKQVVTLEQLLGGRFEREEALISSPFPDALPLIAKEAKERVKRLERTRLYCR